MAIKCLRHLILCFTINVNIALKYNESVHFNMIKFILSILAVMKKSGLDFTSCHKQLENWAK